MKRWPASIRGWLRAQVQSDTTAVLAVTASVQGLVVAAQLLAALVVSPEELGQIRWVESVFAVALLAASCGMPPVAFREAALRTSMMARGRLLIAATILSSVAGLVMIAGGAAVSLAWAPQNGSWLLLLLLCSAVLPANAGRIAVGIVQGGRLAKKYVAPLVGFSTGAVLVLGAAAAWAGPHGWVVARVLVEVALAGMLCQALIRGTPTSENLLPDWPTLRSLARSGASANYAFLIRVLADNLPLLLLAIAGSLPKEVGIFGLANLLLFAPMLMLSVTMQSRLPGLIQSIREGPGFRAGLSAALHALLRTAMLWCLLMLCVAAALHLQLVLPEYSEAAVPLAILASSLPARAVVVAAGGAAVAYGRFALSSVLTIVEIGIVAIAYFSGAAGATHMAIAVAGAVVVAMLPSSVLLRVSRTRWPESSSLHQSG